MHVCVQLEVQDRVNTLADLDEQIAEMHKRLEKQLLQQLETQELLRYMPSFVWERYTRILWLYSGCVVSPREGLKL